MNYTVAALERLTEEFEKMPSIGRKTAERLAFYVLGMSDNQLNGLTESIKNAHDKIHRCKVCQNLTEEEVCSVCRDEMRNRKTILVVEDPRDVMSFEKTGEYDGLYHVLHGTIDPINGIGPDQIGISELLKRVSAEDSEVSEIIMATNTDVGGEATSKYISKLLKPLGVKVSRLAYGVPVGASIEYADEVTLLRALEGRNEM